MTSALPSSWKALTITVGLSTFLGSFVAAFSYENHNVAFPVSALCSIAVLWITARRARETFAVDARGAFTLAVGASAVTVFLVMGVHVFHVRPAWVESTFNWRDHNEPPAWLVLPSLVSMVGLPLAIAFTESLVFELHRPLRRVIGVLLPWLAVAVGVLSVMGVARAKSHAAPRSPIDGLPVVASFQAPSAAGAIERHPLGALTLTVACVQGYDVDCHVLLQSDPTLPLPADWPLNVSRLRYPRRQESSVRSDATLQVLRDQRHDLWIIQTPMLHGRPHPIAAFSRRRSGGPSPRCWVSCWQRGSCDVRATWTRCRRGRSRMRRWAPTGRCCSLMGARTRRWATRPLGRWWSLR